MKKTTLLIILAIFSCNGLALAECECPGDVRSPQAKYQQSRVVFTGKVTNVERGENDSNVEFKIFDVYKGDLGQSVMINTVNAGSMAAVCGTQFKEGDDYLIYAYGVSSETAEDIYYSEGCASIKKLSCAEEDIQKISKYSRVRSEQLDTTTPADLKLAKEMVCCDTVTEAVVPNQCQKGASCALTAAESTR